MMGLRSLTDQAKADKEAAEKARQKRRAARKNAKEDQLTADEIKTCKQAFKTFDSDSNGSIDKWELRLALETMNRTPTDEDLVAMIEELDASGNGKLEFNEFLQALVMQKQKDKDANSSGDLVDAFVAMGGNPDMTGFVNSEQLRKVIKDDFLLTIKIDEFMDDLDVDNDGFVNFEEFKQLLGA